MNLISSLFRDYKEVPVLIVENSSRNSWSLGRIIDVKHDKNGFARIASVKTQTTTLDRPIHKLCMIMESDS